MLCDKLLERISKTAWSKSIIDTLLSLWSLRISRCFIWIRPCYLTLELFELVSAQPLSDDVKNGIIEEGTLYKEDFASPVFDHGKTVVFAA